MRQGFYNSLPGRLVPEFPPHSDSSFDPMWSHFYTVHFEFEFSHSRSPVMKPELASEMGRPVLITDELVFY